MPLLNLSDVSRYVEDNIGVFHQKRIASLDNLSLSKVLKRKNPYLFKAKFVQSAEQIVRGLVDAHISSNEETVFGDWLEGLAIFINSEVYGGWKSGIPGIDLEFDNEGRRYVVSIKSGPNWGNSSQINKMVADFTSAGKTLRTSNSRIQVIAVNGCCYGQENKPDKGNYFKYCGQKFWSFISGENELYTQIIEPLGHKAQEKNEEFQISYALMLNRFTLQFGNEYCTSNGAINWQKLVRLNSSEASR